MNLTREKFMHSLSHNQRIRILILVSSLLAAYSVTSALPSHQKEGGGSAQLFAYKQSVPFDVKKASERQQDGIIIQDIDYAAYTPERGRVKAYLIKPKGTGPFAGILFFHWLGEPNGNRNQFIDEATALGKQGTISLLIEGHFPWTVEPKDGQTDRRRVIDETIEVRRALDLLLSQPEVDPKRIAYVGHDYGAMYGAIVSGVDKRVKTYVLMAPIGNFSDWSLVYWLDKIPDKDKQAYRNALRDVDPIQYVSHAKPSPILLQFANTDKYISKTAATELAEAASEPKEVKWYDAKHDLNVEEARNDRDKWLTQQLGLANAN
jgi:dienelactone hydrolase